MGFSQFPRFQYLLFSNYHIQGTFVLWPNGSRPMQCRKSSQKDIPAACCATKQPTWIHFTKDLGLNCQPWLEPMAACEHKVALLLLQRQKCTSRKPKKGDTKKWYKKYAKTYPFHFESRSSTKFIKIHSLVIVIGA